VTTTKEEREEFKRLHRIFSHDGEGGFNGSDILRYASLSDKFGLMDVVNMCNDCLERELVS